MVCYANSEENRDKHSDEPLIDSVTEGERRRSHFKPYFGHENAGRN